MTNYNGGTSSRTPNITIKESTFSPTDNVTPMPTVIIDIPCKFNATSSTFTGSMNGLTIRQGTAILKDCTISSNLKGMSDYDIQIYENSGGWMKSLVAKQGALIVGNYIDTYPYSDFAVTNYSAPVSVTLSGTTQVTSNNPGTRNAIIVRAKDDNASAVTLKVDNKCTITGLVKFLGGKISATGISATE